MDGWNCRDCTIASSVRTGTRPLVPESQRSRSYLNRLHSPVGAPNNESRPAIGTVSTTVAPARRRSATARANTASTSGSADGRSYAWRRTPRRAPRSPSGTSDAA